MNEVVWMECDMFGEIVVLVDWFWGVQIECLLQNFWILMEKQLFELIYVFVIVKCVVVVVNQLFGVFVDDKVYVIIVVVDEIIVGKYLCEFLFVVWQMGFGMQINMNFNEVIVNCVSELMGGECGEVCKVYLNDDVNCGQLLNDVFLIVMYVVVVYVIVNYLLLVLCMLCVMFDVKLKVFVDIVKIGCMYLQDVMLFMFGQEFFGYVVQFDQGICYVELVLLYLYEFVFGGIVVGMGLNVYLEFVVCVVDEIGWFMKLLFVMVLSKFEVMVVVDVLVFVYGVLKMVVVSLMKIVNDVCWFVSGLCCGFGELLILENELGSLIMLGKVNLMQLEVVMMLCCQVFGNDVVVNVGGVSGNFELNVFWLMIVYNVL